MLGYYMLGRFSPIWAASWLFLTSVVFYGYWMPEFTLLLLGSILWNFLVGSKIGKLIPAQVQSGRKRQAKRWLILGITVDLALLAYFKYAGFFVTNLNAVLGQDWSFGKIILPIGISFFTFTQIAFLADAYLKGTREYRLIHFGLFVTYFPHLIAGPVLHHAQMMPQFREPATYRLNVQNIAPGLLIFAFGLFKKIVLADGISPYADAVFNAAEAGHQPDTIEAWIGALAYTFQLYFDFSGYSDMAVGLSWMFNVRLPYNFNSPYKAVNIADFWRRWHITLSSFLRDYLYFPLGGNRLGPSRRYINLMITMILGGLWHGANWTFVFWGMLHGIYLTINHAFQRLSSPGVETLRKMITFRLFSWWLTFLCAVVAWVFFRANDFSSALRIIAVLPPTMTGGDLAATHPILWNQGLNLVRGIWWLTVLGAIAFLLPNSNRIGELALVHCRTRPSLPFILIGAALALCVFLIVVNSTRDSVSAFIYFNF